MRSSLAFIFLASIAICQPAQGAVIVPLNPGFTSLPANDDGFAGPISLAPTVGTINFFGNNYSSLFVNNNGNLTFLAGNSSYFPGGLTGATGQPIIAPFYADVDTRFGGTVQYGATTFGGNVAFGVTWNLVAGYGLPSSLTDSFQVLLVDRPDVGAGDFDIVFNYDLIEWDTGTASGGNSARVGYSNGTGVPGSNFQLAGSGVNGAFLDTGSNALINNELNSGVDGRYIFQVRNGVINPAPVPEPATLAIWGGLGLAGLVAARRRKRLTA